MTSVPPATRRRHTRALPGLALGAVLALGALTSPSAGASTAAPDQSSSAVAKTHQRVPSVVGRSKAGALRKLDQAGFRVKVKTEIRTSGENGIVLRQSPAGSKNVEPRTKVTIVVSSVRTPAPPPVVTPPVVIPPIVPPPVVPPAQSCTPGYSPCLAPASDYDCAGGSGNGPAYAHGPIYVTGSDPYGLDADGDGVACEY